MIEIIVDGTPRSLQASSRGREQWKCEVQQSAESRMEHRERLQWCDVSVRIVHFCFDWKLTDGDLDNIAKPILDAISGVVFFDDCQIQQLHMRRTDLRKNRLTIVEGASSILVERLEQAYEDESNLGFVYIAVDTMIDHTRLA